MYMYAPHMHTRSHTQMLSLAAAAGFEVNRIGVDEAKARVRHSAFIHTACIHGHVGCKLYRIVGMNLCMHLCMCVGSVSWIYTGASLHDHGRVPRPAGF